MSPSPSVAVTGAPMFVALAVAVSPMLSSSVRVAVLAANAGALLAALTALVVALPGAEYPPSPSSFVARTRTW